MCVGFVIAWYVVLLLKSAVCKIYVCTFSGYNTFGFGHHVVQAAGTEAYQYGGGEQIKATWHNTRTSRCIAGAKEVEGHTGVRAARCLHFQSYGSSRQLLAQI